MNRRTILAGAGIIIAALTVTACKSGTTTAPSGHSSSTAKATAAPAKTAVAGDFFDVKDASGDSYRVTLVKVVDPAQGADQFTTPDNGKRFVGAVFTITALSGSPKNEDANNDATVVGANGQTYTPDFSQIAGYTDFSSGNINVAQGQSVTGAVTFQVPTGVSVTRVLWSTSSGFSSSVQWSV